MLLQGQHFLLNYLKTLSVGLNLRPPAEQTGTYPIELTTRRLAQGTRGFFSHFFSHRFFFLSEVFPRVQREASFHQPHVIVKWCIKGCHFHTGHILDLTETENHAWKASGTQGMLM